MSLSLRSNPKLISVGLIVFFLSLGLLPVLAQDAKDKQKAKKKAEEKAVRITEEILVVGKAPKDVPLATVSTVVANEP